MSKSEWGPTASKGGVAPKPVVQVGGTDPSGNIQSCEIDGSGNLKVAVTGAGSGGTSSVDESAFTAGVSAGTPAMGVYEATPTTLTDGDMGIVGVTSDRALKVYLTGGGGSGGTSSTFGAAFPADGTAIGIADPDGTMAALSAETFDYDTGAGTVAVTAPGLSIPASGGPLPVLGGHGTAAQALRVELPTDGTGVIATVGAVTAITNALPAGTNVIGHVIADSGSTTAVTGDVTVIQGTATNLKAQAEVYQGGSAVAAGNPLQVTLANTGANATPVLVDGTGGTFPVSGTVTANQGTSPWIVGGGGTAGSAAAQVVTVQGVASMTPVQVSQATASNLNAAVVGTGAAGTAATGVVTVQGIASMTKLLVTPDANSAVNVAQFGGTNVVTGGTAGTQSVGGIQAHDAADSGNNPVKVGAKATNVEPTAVSATGDIANLITDMVGKLIVAPYTNPENLVSGVISSAMTGTTSTSLISAPASGLRNYITQITVSNTHATVGTNMELQDGNGGTTFYIIPAAAVYGGAALTFPAPLRQPTTATAIYIKNTTTGASTFASASGYKGV